MPVKVPVKVKYEPSLKSVHEALSLVVQNMNDGFPEKHKVVLLDVLSQVSQTLYRLEHKHGS